MAKLVAGIGYLMDISGSGDTGASLIPDGYLMRGALGRGGNLSGADQRVVVAPPDGFPWTPPFIVYADGSTSFDDRDAWNTAVRPPPNATRYVSPDGDDGNDGLTWATALRTINYARTRIIGTGGPGHVYIAPGLYDTATGFATPAWSSQPVAFIGATGNPDDVIVGAFHPAGSISWAANGTHAGVFDTTSTVDVGTVVDLRDKHPLTGIPIKLHKLDSLAEVAALPGSWAIVGSTVHIHLADGATPETNVNTGLLRESDGVQVGSIAATYMEALTALGGFSNTTIGGKMYARDCKFAFGCATPDHNAFMCRYKDEVILHSCVAAHGRYDGFNYHNLDGASQRPTSRVAEIHCQGWLNGEAWTAAQNQPSTAHENIDIVRIGCFYGGSPQGVTDANDSNTWIVGGGYAGADDVMQGFGAEVPGELYANSAGSAWLDGFKPMGRFVGPMLFSSSGQIRHRRIGAPTASGDVAEY